MSLQLVLDSAQNEHARAGTTASTDDFANSVYLILGEDAVRGEVYELVREKELANEVSMMEIHAILDALIVVLKGGS